MSKMIVKAPVVQQREIAKSVYQLTLHSPELTQQAVPGQFIHLRVTENYQPLLRRPLSISSVNRDAGTLSTIYRIVGQGTMQLSTFKTDAIIDCMGPLGKGFDLQCHTPLLIGGGMGLAPLVFLAQRLCPRPLEILMGGRNEQELFWQTVYRDICDKIHITTDDGSLGRRGFTVDILPDLLDKGTFDRIYACGPRPMLEAIAAIAKQFAIPCQVSLEEHMACGVGACLSCTCAGTDGKRRKVCTDGPVFWAGEVFG